MDEQSSKSLALDSEQTELFLKFQPLARKTAKQIAKTINNRSEWREIESEVQEHLVRLVQSLDIEREVAPFFCAGLDNFKQNYIRDRVIQEKHFPEDRRTDLSRLPDTRPPIGFEELLDELEITEPRHRSVLRKIVVEGKRPVKERARSEWFKSIRPKLQRHLRRIYGDSIDGWGSPDANEDTDKGVQK